MSRWAHGPGAVPVREPAVAGSFYPAAADRLDAMVHGLLREAARLPGVDEPAVTGLPAGLLVPHAGLTYSGVTAAAAWGRLAGFAGPEPVVVIVLGTNH